MLKLWPNVEEIPGYRQDFPEEIPHLTPFLLKKEKPHGAVIVCPGGGYHHRAEHEGAPVAEWLNSLGISAFVLHYRVAPYQHPVPYWDARRAIRYVRYHAAEWNLDPEKIGILGFSAGGHLAASTGIYFDEGNPKAADPVERMSSRPGLMVLAYPVIVMDGEFAHQGSRERLLGEAPDPDALARMSLEKNVSANTPPAFLWHTANDASVPVENSLWMAAALSRCRVPFELHVFPEGKHGLGLAPNLPEVAVWKDLCAAWLKKQWQI